MLLSYLNRGASRVKEIGTEGLKAMAEGTKRRIVRLRRFEKSDQGIFGEMSTDSGFSIYIGECPDRDNAPGLSCVRPDRYSVEGVETPRHGWAYKLEDKHGRTGVLFHAGNFVGDRTKGYKSNSEGCLIPGRAVGEIAGQKAVLSSRDALNAFVEEMERQPFILEITEDYNA
jgi:hypothetical protein